MTYWSRPPQSYGQNNCWNHRISSRFSRRSSVVTNQLVIPMTQSTSMAGTSIIINSEGWCRPSFSSWNTMWLMLACSCPMTLTRQSSFWQWGGDHCSIIIVHYGLEILFLCWMKYCSWITIIIDWHHAKPFKLLATSLFLWIHLSTTSAKIWFPLLHIISTGIVNLSSFIVTSVQTSSSLLSFSFVWWAEQACKSTIWIAWFLRALYNFFYDISDYYGIHHFFTLPLLILVPQLVDWRLFQA